MRASHRTTQRTLPPGTLARVVGDLALCGLTLSHND